MLFLDRLPTKADAGAIRDYLGIAKKPELSVEQVELRRARISMVRQDAAKEPALSEEEVG